METSLSASLFPQEETLSLVVHVVDGSLFTRELGVLNWWRCAASLWISIGNRGQMFFSFLPEYFQSRDPAKDTLLFPEVHIWCYSKYYIQEESSTLPPSPKAFSEKESINTFPSVCPRSLCPNWILTKEVWLAILNHMEPLSSIMSTSHIRLYFHVTLQTFEKTCNL